MMPRYIDAETFDADCRKRYCTDCDNYNGLKCRACWVDDMLSEVEDAPTVSPDEARGVGKWIKRFDGPYGHGRTYCSSCGKHSGIGGIKQTPPYCPNCGAKMEVE
jgi:hypothetical protein